MSKSRKDVKHELGVLAKLFQGKFSDKLGIEILDNE